MENNNQANTVTTPLPHREGQGGESGSKSYLISIVMVAVLGGLLFGYDTAVISGAEKGLQAFFKTAGDFDYTDGWHGFTSASALIGFIDSYRLYAINGGVKLKAGRTVIVTRSATKDSRPTFDASCQQDEEEQSEEEQSVTNAVRRWVVEINDVRCTVLYPGMTLSSIAMKYDISKQELLEFNEMASEAGLSEGDIIFLDKKKKKYTGAQDFCRAKAGDTLYAISQRFGIRLASLAKMNGKDLFSGLTEGEKIILK